MALTVAEAKKVTRDEGRRGVMEIIEQNASIIPVLPWETVDTFEHFFTREKKLPAASTRNVGGTWTRSTGALERVSIPLKIIGGEFDIDQFILDQGGNEDDIFARQFALRTKANAFHVEELIFDGNSLTTPSQFDGLRTLLTGNQLYAFSATGAALTIASLDELLTRVPGATHLWMNRSLQKYILQRLQDVSTSAGHPQVFYDGVDDAGKPVVRYGNARIMVVERMDDGSTILDFDEDPGDATSDTASIYATRVGMDGLYGTQGVRGPTDRRDLGEDFDAPRRVGRAEWYCNIVLGHPRAAARAFGYTDA